MQPGLVAAIATLSILTIESILLFGSAKLDGRFNFMVASRISEFVVNGVVLLAHHAGQ